VTTAPAAPALVSAPRPASIWWARVTRRSLVPIEHSLIAVDSDRFRAGTPVDLSALDARGRRPTGWLVDVRYRTANGAVVRIDLADHLTEEPVRIAEMHHAGAAIPAVSLAAFTTTGGELLGALRWQLRSGLVESLTVAPRGAGTGRLLAVTADALATLRGWPRPHGDRSGHRPSAIGAPASNGWWAAG
jgi:hypothetical protein